MRRNCALLQRIGTWLRRSRRLRQSGPGRARDVIGHNAGPVIEAFVGFWAKYKSGGSGWLPGSAQACRQLADALDRYADGVTHAKRHVEEAAVTVGAVLVAGTALAFCTAGLSEAAAAVGSASVVAVAGQPSPRWQGGHGNLGMAHGISGPLTLLSTAARQGVAVPGQADAIGRICRWLDRCRIGTGNRTWWPEAVSRTEWCSGVSQQAGPGRPSWCYGAPGLARAQQIAALALTGCLADDTQLALLTDASLCHGWAGLLQTTWRAAHTPGASAELAAHLPALRARTGQHLERHGLPATDGLLEGAAGVLLAQHTTEADAARPTRWDACLLLDG